MKKLYLFLLAVACTAGFAGCKILTPPSSSGSSSSSVSVDTGTESSENSDSGSGGEIVVKQKYTVTFTQFDRVDVVLTVTEGDSIAEADVPAPQERTGYTVVWEKKDLTNVRENITVKALETPNTYTISYNADGGVLENATQKVTYDSPYTLATPVYGGHTFLGWTLDGKAVDDGEAWNIADDVTLVAQWQEIVTNTYTITFKQIGEEIKTVTVKEGESCSADKIPAVAEKIGYIVVWEDKDLSNVRENITINAVMTAKEYTIAFDAGDGTPEKTELKVTFDAAYSLPGVVPKKGYEFLGWTLDNEVVPSSGTWKTDGSVTYVAKYKAKTYTVTLNVNGGNALSQTTISVTYGESYELPTPTHAEANDMFYTFVGWKNGSESVSISGTWTIADDVTFAAEWKASGSWTSNY